MQEITKKFLQKRGLISVSHRLPYNPKLKEILKKSHLEKNNLFNKKLCTKK